MSFKIIQPKSPFKQRSVSPNQKKNQQKIANFENSFYGETSDYQNFKMSRILDNQTHLIQPEPLSNIKEIARDILDLAQNHQDDSYEKNLKSSKQIDPLDTVNRLLNAEYKKKEKILNKQINVYMDELAEMQSGVKINPKSEHILRNKNYQPIHLRTEEVIQQKQEKLYKLYQQYQEEKELKDPQPSFTPNLEKHNQIHKRTFQEFISDMDNWIEKKNKNKQVNTYQVISQQMEKTTFKPKINKKSLQILKEKNKNQENLDLAARMEIKSKEYEQNKKQLEMQIKQKYSYTPQINQKSKRMASRSQNKRNFKDGTAASNSKSPPKSKNFVIEMPHNKNLDTSPRTLVKSHSSISIRQNQSSIRPSLKNDIQNSNNKLQQQENISFQRQSSFDQLKPNQSYSNDFRVDEIANNREEILKKLSDYDKFKQYADNKLVQSQSARNEENVRQQQQIRERIQQQNNNFNKVQFLETVQQYNVSKDSDLSSNHMNQQRSVSPFQNNSALHSNQSSYFHTRKKSHSRSISPNQNHQQQVSKYSQKMTLSPSKNSQTRSLQLQDSQRQSNNYALSSKDSVNQVLYHPNLDFIIGILSKKEKINK
ncbi:hypothetical protein TTHERM_00372510 (macronuclear) [Tetrahymena thermophila SB210]|uniref:Uncharacterized protein n=1 Tax=Tetrahymena thermophila (strain SB210) TaxID=312017 RepID=I7LU34_TETTS|nr:hypothetical protein TTHERM_00372510 [Tetrahymena thermophila SB210]EAR89334.2 hypothetical protein TTHERM_00372510 [Tetrahymena thermophila SB210]|eukprot:XP_001009579.2 hypothetical protein TTHERM_00372510 [Tetrahymena thermophila SB210]